MLPYLSPEDRERELERLALAAKGEVVDYGVSREGRALRAVRVPSRGTAEGAVLASANIHGVEYIGGKVVFGLLNALADPRGAFAELRDRAEVWVVPCINPDGYARTWSQEGSGAVRELRPNAEGDDLNRNFPLPFGAKRSVLPVAGSTRKGSTFYCGSGPLSEPETRGLDTLFQRMSFRASVNMHSFMGTFIPPRVLLPEHFAAYRELCRAFSSAQPRKKYVRLASRIFDAFTGEQEDHQHHVYGTWAICTEVFAIADSFRQHLIGPSTFWRFNPRDPTPWVDNDVPGIASYFLAALKMPPANAGGAGLPASI